LVSVISIFRNEQRFLQEAIDSVSAQTSPAWELLLVDDGSTDQSSEIARLSARADPNRIRYLTHQGACNRGKSSSRNLGLRTARGEFVAFLDGDDVFRPEKIERQSGLLTKVSAAMVYGRTLYWNQWPGAPSTASPDWISELHVDPNRVYDPPELLTRFLRESGAVPCLCGLLVRRTVALQVGGFDERIQDLYEDQVFLAKICARFPVFVEDGCWDQYRQHPDSSSSRAIASGDYHPRKADTRSRLVFLRWLEEFLRRENVLDPGLTRALQDAYFPYRHPRLYSRIYRTQCLLRRLRSSLKKRLNLVPGRKT
jgi:glycosyltransferase involved in cell wall biosynthesis